MNSILFKDLRIGDTFRICSTALYTWEKVSDREATPLDSSCRGSRYIIEDNISCVLSYPPVYVDSLEEKLQVAKERYEVSEERHAKTAKQLADMNAVNGCMEKKLVAVHAELDGSKEISRQLSVQVCELSEQLEKAQLHAAYAENELATERSANSAKDAEQFEALKELALAIRILARGR